MGSRRKHQRLRTGQDVLRDLADHLIEPLHFGSSSLSAIFSPVLDEDLNPPIIINPHDPLVDNSIQWIPDSVFIDVVRPPVF